MSVKELFQIEKKGPRGLLAAEWVIMGYLAFTLVVIAALWGQIDGPGELLRVRCQYVLVTLAMWGVYRLVPCRLTMLARVAVQLLSLGWWYSDTYELNRHLPNLDHLFASAEQAVFGCQPSLLFAQRAPWDWFSELMCLGYVSYFPLIALTTFYYFLWRYHEFQKAVFVILASFFSYYVIFVLLPVTGPQFYYLAAGEEKIAAGIFPDVGDWFLTHSERMAAPGWSDGVFHRLLHMAHDAGERPTAAFPSSHVGITTVLMLLAMRTHSRRLVLTMLPFYVLMCLATVYIYAHYAIDAIAGLVTGAVFYYAFYRLKS